MEQTAKQIDDLSRAEKETFHERMKQDLKYAVGYQMTPKKKKYLDKDFEYNMKLFNHVMQSVAHGDGVFTEDDLLATQETIHQNLAVVKPHPSYRWIDVSWLPETFFVNIQKIFIAFK